MTSNKPSSMEKTDIENKDCSTFNTMGDDEIVETGLTNNGGAAGEFLPVNAGADDPVDDSDFVQPSLMVDGDNPPVVETTTLHNGGTTGEFVHVDASDVDPVDAVGVEQTSLMVKSNSLSQTKSMCGDAAIEDSQLIIT